ncbi:hypothetical protein [Mesorhizobium sp. 128a]
MSSVIVEHWQERKSKNLGSSSYRYRRVERLLPGMAEEIAAALPVRFVEVGAEGGTGHS